MLSELEELTDKGYVVVIHRNILGSTRAIALQFRDMPTLPSVPQIQIADDYTPDHAVSKLAAQLLDKCTE